MINNAPHAVLATATTHNIDDNYISRHIDHTTAVADAADDEMTTVANWNEDDACNGGDSDVHNGDSNGSEIELATE